MAMKEIDVFFPVREEKAMIAFAESNAARVKHITFLDEAFHIGSEAGYAVRLLLNPPTPIPLNEFAKSLV